MSKARKSMVPMARGLTFEHLILSIRGVDEELSAQAGRAINISLTRRNWLIGCSQIGESLTPELRKHRCFRGIHNGPCRPGAG